MIDAVAALRLNDHPIAAVLNDAMAIRQDRPDRRSAKRDQTEFLQIRQSITIAVAISVILVFVRAADILAAHTESALVTLALVSSGEGIAATRGSLRRRTPVRTVLIPTLAVGLLAIAIGLIAIGPIAVGLIAIGLIAVVPVAIGLIAVRPILTGLSRTRLIGPRLDRRRRLARPALVTTIGLIPALLIRPVLIAAVLIPLRLTLHPISLPPRAVWLILPLRLAIRRGRRLRRLPLLVPRLLIATSRSLTGAVLIGALLIGALLIRAILLRRSPIRRPAFLLGLRRYRLWRGGRLMGGCCGLGLGRLVLLRRRLVGLLLLRTILLCGLVGLRLWLRLMLRLMLLALLLRRWGLFMLGLATRRAILLIAAILPLPCGPDRRWNRLSKHEGHTDRRGRLEK
ncbi:hypothetical protein FGG78_21280 [Thioclava sp. BHET1]|nr:hypothetical protein FGG78_21280 [Thioclava sp. BHET1]